MKFSTHHGCRRVLGVASAMLLINATMSFAGSLPYETPPILPAAQLLPESALAGPKFKVRNDAVSDGYMYSYTIASDWGELKASSTLEAEQVIGELAAVERLEALEGSKEFGGAMKKAAGGVAQGATDLVTRPVDSLKGAATGVGAMFGRAREAVANPGAKGAQEDSALANLAGFSKVKREYARAFGVDVYSRNPILQEHLDSVARAAFAGDITAKMAMMVIPGGAGAAVSVAGNSARLNDTVYDLPPLELRKRNRSALDAMKINADVADLFIGNTVFTPTEQTAVVEAMMRMATTRNRDAYFKNAVLTNGPETAAFRYRQAQMYAAYHASKPIERFVSVGEVALGQRADGTLVFCAPLDALYWTAQAAGFLEAFDAALPSVGGVTGKELVLGGTISPMAYKELTGRGWKVQAAR